MTEHISNKKPSRLKQSPHFREIAAILLSEITLQEAHRIIIEQFEESWDIKTLQRHRDKLKKLVEEVKLVKATIDARRDSLVHELKTISMDLQKAVDIHLDPSQEKYGDVGALKRRISLYLRHASEFYDQFAHLDLICSIMKQKMIRGQGY